MISPILMRSMSRIAMIEYMFRPVSSTAKGRSRKKHYSARHRMINAAYPLMTPDEQARADRWMEVWPIPDE